MTDKDKIKLLEMIVELQSDVIKLKDKIIQDKQFFNFMQGGQKIYKRVGSLG
jgi:hypothetical protein